MHTVSLTPDLISACASLSRAAFADDELNEWLLPHRFRYPEQWQQQIVNRLHMRMNSPNIGVQVALSDQKDEWWDGSVGPEVLGYAVWERHGKGGQDEAVWGKDGLGKKFERFAAGIAATYSDLLRLDRTVDYGRLALFRAASSTSGKLTDDQVGRGGDHIWLAFLGVDPRFQRKGIGKHLLQWGIKRSHEEGIPIGLIASPVGWKLYWSVGFQNTGTLKVEGLSRNGVMMFRWPEGTRRDTSVQKIIEEQASAA